MRADVGQGGRWRRGWRWLFGDFFSVVPQFLKYQVATKLLMGILVLPLFGVATSVVVGDATVTNANLASFLFSPRGVAFLVLMAALVGVGLLVEIVGFITISARHSRGQPESRYAGVLKHSLWRLPNFLEIGGLALVVYAAAIIPLTGLGAGVSFLEGVKIPNFITSAIESTPPYFAAYVLALALLTVVSALLVFTLHFIVIGNLKAGAAMKASAGLVRRHPWLFLVGFVWKSLVVMAVVGVVLVLWWVGVGLAVSLVDVDSVWPRAAVILLLLVQQVGFLLVEMVFVPFEVNMLTHLFYEASERDPELAIYAEVYPDIPGKSRRSLLDRILGRPRTLIAAGVAALVVVAIPASFLFNDVFRADANPPKVVAHRAGGRGAPENSLSGLRKAIDAKADYVEIDVQRTADGAYVLNHDDTFARVAGDWRAAQELTLDQVRALDISAARDGSERVPTLEEFFLAAKGHVGVFAELKGKTADRRMADEVTSLVRRLDMAADVVLIGLDDHLISYLDAQQSKPATGYLYFLSLGDVSKLPGDYAILEEGEATEGRLATLGEAGKKAIVWTVNTEEAMERFAESHVYAIITDEPEQLRHVLTRSGQATAAELLAKMFTRGE